MRFEFCYGFTVPNLASLDARMAVCHLQADSDRLIGVIEAGIGGVDAFNAALRNVLVRLASQHCETLAVGVARGRTPKLWPVRGEQVSP